MALDAKAIKEEIPDKDVYDSNARRPKGKWSFKFYYKLQLIFFLCNFEHTVYIKFKLWEIF